MAAPASRITRKIVRMVSSRPLASGASRLALPTPVRRLLPIGDGVAARLHRLPVPTRRLDLAGVVAVEEEHRALIGGKVGRRCAVDEEADLRAVGIGVGGGVE